MPAAAITISGRMENRSIRRAVFRDVIRNTTEPVASSSPVAASPTS